MAAETFADLSPPYSTIVADPPWHYAGGTNSPIVTGQGGPHAGGAPLPYSSMTLDEIRALPVATIAARDARVFLWTTNRYLRDAWSVLESWGFEPGLRVFVWCKPISTSNVSTEFFLLGKRGNPPRLPWTNTTWFDWNRKGLRHSQKPAAFGDLVEAWCPGPYVELFARAPRLGWDSWGKGYELASA